MEQSPHRSPHRSPDQPLDRPAIETRDLGRRFGEFTAVDGLDLTVATGEIYGLLGPNGAGKSTTVRMLCTLLAPSAGTAMVAGHDVADRPDLVRLRIGVALQEAALDPKQTGRELLRLQARLYGLRRNEVDRRLAELGELIDLGAALDQPIGSYSGGMARRLDLAAALVHNPEVLFLDEPTTGLDPASRTKVWQEVERLNRTLGMTILLTTQYLEEADALADRVGIIDGGRLAVEGTPDALKRQVGTDLVVASLADPEADATRAIEAVSREPSTAEVHGRELIVSTPNGAATIGPVAVALDAAGIAVHDLLLRTPTLDDVFLEVTGNRLATNQASAAQRTTDQPAAQTEPEPVR
ncbi:MAG: ATP-binding cassette domain-containing protein [Acidimicrobiales bacterium]